MVIALTIALGVLLTRFVLPILIDWSVHKDMTTSETNEWGRGTYEDFKREFDKRQWTASDMFQGSFFAPGQNKIHASIYMFDGKGMVFNPIDYFKVKLRIKQEYRKQMEQSESVDLSES